MQTEAYVPHPSHSLLPFIIPPRRYPKVLRPPLCRKNRLAGARRGDVAQAGRKGSPERRFRRRGADRLPHPDRGGLACRPLVRGGSTPPAVVVRLALPSRIRDRRYVLGLHIPTPCYLVVDGVCHHLRCPRWVLKVRSR